MSKTTNDTGIILRVRPFSEYDALVSIFTKKNGKETFIIKGIRRPKSRLCGIIQPLTAISFEHTLPASASGLGKITQAEFLSPPPNFFDESLFTILEISEKLSPQGQSFSAFFELLLLLQKVKKQENMLAIFLVQSLTLFGYLPEYKECATSGEKISGDSLWHKNGEISQKNKSKTSGIPLSFEEVKILSFWQKNTFKNAEKVVLQKKTAEKFTHFFLQFLEREHGVKIKSRY